MDAYHSHSMRQASRKGATAKSLAFIALSPHGNVPRWSASATNRYQIRTKKTHSLSKSFRSTAIVFQFDFAKTDTDVGGAFLEEGQMKTTLLITATILPFGFVVLAIVSLSYMLAKRRRERVGRHIARGQGSRR